MRENQFRVAKANLTTIIDGAIEGKPWTSIVPRTLRTRTVFEKTIIYGGMTIDPNRIAL